MDSTPYSAYKYQVGGSLAVESSTYVLRQADEDIYEALKAVEFCYVLNSRQLGKSSLMVQTMHQLQAEGFVCATLYISELGTPKITESQWYAGIIYTLTNNFNLLEKIDVPTWWRERESYSCPQRLSQFIEEVLLVEIQKRIVVFVDEIDSILNLGFSADGFFEVIKACYNKRASKPKYENLTFALFGVSTPYELIDNKKLSPFNIGRAIELGGFKQIKAKPLEIGLQGKVARPKAVLQKILEWTGGQPFLTQKICKLVQSSSEPIVAGTEAEQIEALVRSQIIDNWEAKDEPPHLKAIRDRLLNGGKHTVRMLGIYQQICQQEAVTLDGSLEQTELLLSGLVKKKDGAIKTFNRIYQEIFNQNWVEEMLDNQRPYGEKISAWLADNSHQSSNLLRGNELKQALLWAAGKNLTSKDYWFLNASQKSEQNKVRVKLTVALAMVIPFFTIGGGILFGVFTSCPTDSVKSHNGSCLTGAIILEPKRTSSGEYSMLQKKPSSTFKFGTEAFGSGNYTQAIRFFRQAVAAEPTNPELQIYLNNAIARRNGSLFNLAAVIPADTDLKTSQEILDGIAEAQDRFNQNNGLNGRLLEIIITNDSNDPATAFRVAKQLEANVAVLGVVGHNSMLTTEAVLSTYEKAQIARVSPFDTFSQKPKIRLYKEVSVRSLERNIDWRNSSYSAAEVLIATLSTNATRKTVFQKIMQGK